jgi:hypothetical protein
MKFVQYVGMFAMAAGVLVYTAQPLHADNIVINGSFENGMTGWNANAPDPYPFNVLVDSPSGPIGAYVRGADGDYYALFDDWNTASLDQTLSTTPGTSYEVNFWINDQYGNSDLVVNWGSTQLLHVPSTYSNSQANAGWIDFDFVVPAGSTSTDLYFAASSDNYLGLDDVSVTCVPEPVTLSLLTLGGLALLRRRSHRRFGSL